MRTLKLLVMCLLALTASQAARAGMATRLWYSGTGTSVASLKALPEFPLGFNTAHYYQYDDTLGGLPPELTFLRTGLFDNQSWLNNYGTWTRGFIQAPQTGNYRFFIYSDDDSEFWISTGTTPSGLTKACENVGAVGRGSWSGKAAQVSGLINLQRGQTYYYEVFMKEGGGDDYFGVGWSLPDGSFNRPVSGKYLVPHNHVFTKFDAATGTNSLFIQNAPTFAMRQYTGFNTAPAQTVLDGTPQDVTAGETLNTVIEGTVMGAQPMSFQWLVLTNGGSSYTVVTGAVFQGLDITNLSVVLHDQNRYRLVASNSFGIVTSTVPALLTVTPDAIKPTIVSAQSFGRTNAVTVIFSEKLKASTVTAAKFAVTNQTLGVTVLSVNFDGDRTVTLNTTPMPAAGVVSVVYTVVVNNITDVALVSNTILPNSTLSFVQVDGVFNSRRYLDIGGTDIPSLTNNAKFINGVYSEEFKNILEANQDSADNYGAELIGYLVPNVSGAYSFWISADDNANLFLSTDANPANKVLIAREPEWNGARDYNTGDRRGDPRANGRRVNRSDDINLVAGRAYFFQGLMKEGGGGDNFSIAWQLPGAGAPANGSSPITGANLSAFTNFVVNLTPPTLTLQPSNTVVAEGTRATFFSSAAGGQPMTYRWFRDGALVDGANSANYSVFPARMGDNGATFFMNASNIGGGPITSTNAVLTVLPDTNAPVLVRARGSATRREITLDFNEFLDPRSVTNALAQGAFTVSPFINVVGARLSGAGTNVVLSTDLQTEGQLYTVNVNGFVADNSSNTNAIGSTNAQFLAWVFSKGFALRQWYEGIGGTAVANLTSAPTYPDAPNRVDYLSGSLNQAQTSPDLNNFGTRITGWIKPPTLADPSYSNFWAFFIASDDASRIRVSTDDNSLNLATNNAAQEDGCCNALATSNPFIDGIGRVITTLNPYGTHYFEILMKEGGGGDFVNVALMNLAEPGTVTESTLAPLSSAFFGVYADPTGVAVTFTTQPLSRSVPESASVVFTSAAVATNNGAQSQVAYQWQRKVGGNFVDIEGANGANYTYPRVALADAGAVFRVQASTPGATANSAEATITISAPDTTPPRVFGLRVAEDFTNNMNKITVLLSEPVTNFTVGLPGVTYTLAATNGSGSRTVSSAVIRNGTNLVLTLSSKLAENTWYSLTMAGVKDVSAAGNVLSPNSTVFRSPVFVAGRVFARKYDNIGGGSVDNLWAGAGYPNSPSIKALLSQADFPGSNDNYGYWIRGYVVPNFDGTVFFAISSDDNSRLFFNPTDDAPAGRVAIANEPQWNDYRSFVTGDRRTARTVTGSPYQATRYDNQSADFEVSNGTRYYFDYYQKEGGGGDSGSVGWQIPGGPVLQSGGTSVIQPNNLGILVDPNDWEININTQPLSSTNAENAPVTFSVAANATSPGALSETVLYQWKRNGTPISGATGASFLTFAALTNNGAVYSVDLSFTNATTNLIAGAIASSSAILTVVNDTVSPTLVSAVRSAIANSNVFLTFSEPLIDTPATNPASYRISGLTVTAAAVGSGGRVVTLTTSGPLLNNAVYFASAIGVRDASAAGNSVTATVRVSLNGPVQLTGAQNLGGFEAENFDMNTAQGSSFWALTSPALRPVPSGFSGAGVMEAQPNQGLSINDPNILTTSPRLDYLVNFPTSGIYFVWVRAWGASGSDDSIHIGLNGTVSQYGTNINNIPGGSSYTWYATATGGPARVEVPSAGNHTLNIWMREDGVVLDRVLLTTDSAYVPSSNGPAEAGRSIVAPVITLRSLKAGNSLTLSWDGAGALQGSTTVTGVWNMVSTNSPVTTNTASGSSFFRLNVPLVP